MASETIDDILNITSDDSKPKLNIPKKISGPGSKASPTMKEELRDRQASSIFSKEDTLLSDNNIAQNESQPKSVYKNGASQDWVDPESRPKPKVTKEEPLPEFAKVKLKKVAVWVKY
jgi:hypothetical protein